MSGRAGVEEVVGRKGRKCTPAKGGEVVFDNQPSFQVWGTKGSPEIKDQLRRGEEASDKRGRRGVDPCF